MDKMTENGLEEAILTCQAFIASHELHDFAAGLLVAFLSECVGDIGGPVEERHAHVSLDEPGFAGDLFLGGH